MFRSGLKNHRISMDGQQSGDGEGEIRRRKFLPARFRFLRLKSCFPLRLAAMKTDLIRILGLSGSGLRIRFNNDNHLLLIRCQIEINVQKVDAIILLGDLSAETEVLVRPRSLSSFGQIHLGPLLFAYQLMGN